MRRVPRATKRDDGDRGGGDALRRERLDGVLDALGHVLDELRGVVGDRHHRQAFDGCLQVQLELGPAVHLGEELLVLAFELDLDAGAQQLAVAGDAAGEVFLAAGHGLAGVHGGQQAPLHELVEGGQAGDAPLAELFDALHHEAVIGPGGAEAEGGAGHRVLDFGGQGGELGQHAALVLGHAGGVGAVHQVGQALLGAPQQAADLLGHREGQQGHQPVGLDLDQALHGAAGLALGEGDVDDQEAGEAVFEQKSVNTQAAPSATVAPTVWPVGASLAITLSG
jgi:hypothetical protein